MVASNKTMSMTFIKDCVYGIDQYHQAMEEMIDRLKEMANDRDSDGISSLLRDPQPVNPSPRPGPIPRPSGSGCDLKLIIPDGYVTPNLPDAIKLLHSMTECVWLALAGMDNTHQFDIPNEGHPSRPIRFTAEASE